MRYRPLGNTGMAVSAVSLVLGDMAARPRPQDWISSVYTALENGINAFEVAGHAPALVEGFAEAIGAVDRNLVFVGWRLGWTLTTGGPKRDFSAEGLANAIESGVARTGLGYLDAVILDEPQSDELSPQALDTLKRLRDMGRVRMVGVLGADEATDAYISSGAFDLLATSFSLLSGWKERLRLKAAIDRDMAVIGYGYRPADLSARIAQATPDKPKLWGRSGHSHPLAGIGAYGFLSDTPKWSPDEICLGYALTEPSLCTVQIVGERLDLIESLAHVADRELPPNVPAQIEMARFSPTSAAPPAPDVARRA
jgi:aryl-alcohol dehydrogenase-like predicted oxidoreductase